MAEDAADFDGRFRRSVRVRGEGEARFVGTVQDDFHHFVIRLRVTAGRVAAIAAETLRAPWSTCAAADLPLLALVGQPLVERASDIGRLIDMRAQCTHMFDLAGLLLAAASRHEQALDYEAFVEPAASGTGMDARLEQAGAVALAWRVAGGRITFPVAAAGVPLDRGFRAWSEGLPLLEAERAFVLRRAIFVSKGRRQRLIESDSPDGLGLPVGVCHSLGAAIRRDAIRLKDTRIDYAAIADARARGG